MNRAIKAFLIIPLIPAILFVIVVSVLGLLSGGFSLLPSVAYSMPIWLMFALPVSYIVATAIGIPAFLLFRRLGRLSLRGIALGSSAIGAAIGSLVAYLFSSGPFSCLTVALVFALFGAAAGYVFWWLAYREPNPPLNRMRENTRAG